MRLMPRYLKIIFISLSQLRTPQFSYTRFQIQEVLNRFQSIRPHLIRVSYSRGLLLVLGMGFGMNIRIDQEEIPAMIGFKYMFK